MAKRRIKEYVKYAETVFISLNANRERWFHNMNSTNPCQDTKRSIERIFYDQVISSGLDKTGLSVLPMKEYYNEKNNPNGVKPTDDHFNCPQGLTTLVYAHPTMLNNFDELLSFFANMRKTIKVPKPINEKLSQLDKLGILRKDRYRYLNLKLYINGNPNNVLPTSELEVEKVITNWELNKEIKSTDIKLKPSLMDFIAA